MFNPRDMDLVKLYGRLPLAFKRAATAARGAHFARLRYGSEYRRTLVMLRESEGWAPDTMAAWQRARLGAVLAEAVRTTDRYAGLDPEAVAHAVRTLDLSGLPLLDKATYKLEQPSFVNRERRSVFVSKTSGTTGSPMVVLYDRASVQQRVAFVDRQREWAGGDARGRSVRLSGHHLVDPTRQRPPFWMVNPAERQLLLSTYHLGPVHLPAIMDRLERYAPQFVDGYPSSVRMLARGAAALGRRLPSLRAVITTAEALDPDARAEISDAFGVPVLDYYSASEGVPLIQECVEGRYHLRPESGVFEFHRSDGTPAGPGERAELVTTSFTQMMMPQVRYRSGDYVVLDDDPLAPCACGCRHPTVAGVDGRREDLALAPDGRWIGLLNHRTLKTFESILGSQVVQTAPDAFTLRLVPGPAFDLDALRPQIAAKFTAALGQPVTLDYDLVEALPRGANGKFRSVIRAFEVEAPGADV
ncbi:phenylacetate--CoA ligase family protein [Rubrivirga sp. IMCC45206]|uniref:phenylacetate--CoA ligase family protein n=1 Tax=Rubrivirga sp. IMCC45206 TaxID=3391614 RepID=UPI00398F920E